MEAGRGRDMPGSDVSVERGEIHLPQLLNEEAIADEFSKWEQVSSVAAERFVHRYSPPPARSHTLPSALIPPNKKSYKKGPRYPRQAFLHLHHTDAC